MLSQPEFPLKKHSGKVCACKNSLRNGKARPRKNQASVDRLYLFEEIFSQVHSCHFPALFKSYISKARKCLPSHSYTVPIIHDWLCVYFAFDDKLLRPDACRCLAKNDIPVLPDNLSSAAFL